MIKVEWFYWLIGGIFVVAALLLGRDRRPGAALLWGLLGASFIYGTYVVRKEAPAWVLGVAVLVMAGIAGLGLTGTAPRENRPAARSPIGPWIFLPALLIPLIAVLFGSELKNIMIGAKPFLEKGSETLIGLGVASVVAVIVGMIVLRQPSPVVPLREGTRLIDAIGWAVVLPQMLATLGLVFQAAGVGKQVGRLARDVLPHGSLLAAVILYCVGMALLTVIMGNAFAAFPVMTAAVGWPLLVQQFHGNPSAVFAVGMLAGFCGTLCTPMAANFNIVPAALLELKDRYGPIKAQIPTAVPLLACNIVIVYVSAF